MTRPTAGGRVREASRPGALDTAKVAAGRLWAAAAMPYLASALFATTVRPAPGSGTIAVDQAWQVHADPEVLAGLDVDELGRLLLHLLGHLVRDHAARAEAGGVVPPGSADHSARREPDRSVPSPAGGGAARWNRCADAEINDDLAGIGLLPAVAPDLPADLGCEAGGLAESYLTAAVDGPRRWDCGSGADGCRRPWDGEPDAGVSRRQGEMLRLALAAELQRAERREPGTVPGGWLRWAEVVLPSRVDWRRVLASEIRGALAAVSGCVDYSYRRPSRRAGSSPGVILPSLVRPVPEVAVVCDTSGSMHEQLLARALAEVDGLLLRAGVRRCPVLAVDTAVHALRRVRRAAEVEFAGGGGTDMGAGIEAAAALRPRPQVVVVLTDGFTPWPAGPPSGVRVIVGLLAEGPRAGWDAPAWARCVVVDELAGAGSG